MSDSSTDVTRLSGAEEYFERGQAFYKSGDMESAIAEFTEAIRLDPNRKDAQEALTKLKRVEQKVNDPLDSIELPDNYDEYTEEHWKAIEDSIRINRIGSSPENTEYFANMAKRARRALQRKNSN